MSRSVVTCALALALSLVQAGTAGAGTLFVIDGRGWGHGVGMSQYGAQGYALDGWRYPRILAHYYRGTNLQVLPGRAVRVLLLERRPTVRIGSARPFRIVGANGKRRTLKAGDRRFSVRDRHGSRFPIRVEAGASPLRVDGSAYRGTIMLHRVGKRLAVVNRVPLDRYLRGVVPWEMPYYWHREALKAQAVVARSYALATLKPTSLYDTYADTRSQVYGGIQAERITTNRAIAATRGRVLLWQGRVATTFYHSTSGGRTAPVEQVWPKASPVPYLVSVSDPHDGISKHHRWGPVVLRPEEVSKTIKVPGVRDLVVERTESGRAAAVDVESPSGPRRIDAQDFRRTLGLRSTWFAVRVLNLDPPLRGALADRSVELGGFVRGLRRVRLEQQVSGGSWTVVRRVLPRADGRFTVSVRPRKTTSYRLATGQVAGATITVVPR